MISSKLEKFALIPDRRLQMLNDQTEITLYFLSKSNLGLAATANEDTYLTILDIDGAEWADKLHRRIFRHDQSESALPQGPSACGAIPAERTPLIKA